MTDAKLDELIEEYWLCKSREVILPFQLPPNTTKSEKAKQAILNYVAEQKNQAFNEGVACASKRGDGNE